MKASFVFAAILSLLFPLSLFANEQVDPQWRQIGPDASVAERIFIPIDRGHYSVLFADDEAELVVGLFKQMRALFNKGPLRVPMKKYGVHILSRCEVQRCSKIDHKGAANRLASFDQSWEAILKVRTGFHLKQTKNFGVEIPGGHVRVKDGVRTIGVFRDLIVTLDYDAAHRRLDVRICEFQDPNDCGPQYERGRTIVVARSTTSTLSKSKSVKVDLSKGVFGLGVESYMNAGKKRVRIVLDSGHYDACFGKFLLTKRQYSSGGARLEMSIGASWVADQLLQYDEVIATVSKADCATGKKVGAKFTYEDKLTGAKFENSEETRCAAKSSQVPMSVVWDCQPTWDVDQREWEGLDAKVRWVVDQYSDGSAESFYQPQFHSGMTWFFKAFAKEGEKTAPIEVFNPGNGSKETKRLNLRKF